MRASLLGKTPADQEVLTSRYSAIMTEAFPLVLIYTPEEEAEIHQAGPRRYQRKLTVVVSGILKADDRIDNALDDMQEAIDAAFNTDLTFGGLAMGAAYKKMNSEVNTDGSPQMGAIHLTYEVDYLE